jgi:glyoxylase-like metal-dependent hydrolase (beta-lactamase superfamily II)
VIISHYHQDHVDGVVGIDGKPAFPNAEILVPAVEHKFWMDDGEMSRATPGRMEGLFKNNRRVMSDNILKRLSTYEWGKEIAPGITAISTPGHTPGHTSFVIASGPAKLFVFSDVTNRPELFVRNPGWHAFFDQIPDQAEQTRHKVLDMLVADRMLVQTFHAPFPALGHIEKDGQSYRFVAAPWSPTV